MWSSCCCAPCPHARAAVARHQSIVIFNERLKQHMTWGDVLAMISLSSEFENIMVR